MVLSTNRIGLFQEAARFIHSCYEELGLSPQQQTLRVQEIEQEIIETGTYTHTEFELKHGAKMAWRNSNRCIGRLLWETLEVFDERQVQTAEEAFEKLVHHIDYATNGGDIRSTITVFAPRTDGIDPLRIWNHQLIRYAGYKKEAAVLGDSANIHMTEMCERLGWVGAHTPFDVLPLVIQEHGKAPELFELPTDCVKEVPISHPEIHGVDELNMKWHAVPIISNMRLEIGGIDYPMAPFNGWYMGTEIGARNLADADRYNMLPSMAKLMGLNTNSNRSLWIDKALVELNIAVLHSFQQAGVTLVDHHTAAKQFKVFEKKEQSCGRAVTGNWMWLIPPLSPAATHVYHKPYKNNIVTPNFFYQKDPE
ncbi:nitric oxide synthase [Sporosarcina sp. PTS2304]|uniref:nitric oxide synthase oxygenase n=1 Tax=Sporosarcina sp. PTS2304 TaxID=2283194 RepID=UPI000E0DC039|nr:nitric oxide synthase oxygenase [Sporosarcina sp. PTS2304]AXI00378.1 nitric oxide synthase [Sporosarcina sp. PTS2304]